MFDLPISKNSMNKTNSRKIGIVDLRPNIYKVGIWKQLYADTDGNTHVYFLSDDGVKTKNFDSEFNVYRKSDTWLLENFDFSFPKNLSKAQHRFIKFICPKVIVDIIAGKHDAILVHGYDNLTYLLSIFIAKAFGVKVFLRGEAVLRGNEESKKLKHYYLKILLKIPEVIFYSCEGNKDYWKYYGVSEDKLTPIPCSVDNNFYQNQRKLYDPQQIRKELEISSDLFIVSFAARFTPRKNGIRLIETVSKIENNKILLLFIGDGPERSQMEAVAKSKGVNAMFVGFKDQKEISKYYSIADAGVIISSYDPSPKVLNESMNFGIPMIVFENIGTSRDLIFNNVNGYSIPYGNYYELGEKLRLLSTNPLKAKQMGEMALQTVSKFTFKKNVHYILQKLNNN